MTHKTQLLILAVTKMGEKSLILHTLSGEWGRRGFLVSVGKGNGMALYQPMNILDAEVVENPKSDLWRLRSLQAVHPLAGIRGNIRKNSITMFMGEVLFRMLHEGADEDGLFEWCCRSVMTLDALKDDFANYHLRWLLELASVLGFSPSAEALSPFAGDRLSEILQLLSKDFTGCMMIPLNGPTRNEIAQILLQYIGFHAEINLEIKSLVVLRELYSN